MALATSQAPDDTALARAQTGDDASSDAAGLGRGRAAAFVAPALGVIAVFLVFPAVWTLYLGLTNFRLTGVAAQQPEIVGLDNYTTAVTDDRFQHSLALTLLFVFGSAIVGQTLLGFSIAWTVRSAGSVVRRLLESFVLLAWIIPSSIVAFLWIALLDRNEGTLNAVLGTPGMAWLIEHPMASLIVFNTWRGAAFSMLLFSAALGSVPPSQLETARMSGATVLQQLRDVVFPHIRGHILTNTLLISLWTFNDFTPYLITAGGPEGRSEILPVYIYKVAIFDGQLGFGSAISLIMLLINLALALFYLRLLRERRS